MSSSDSPAPPRRGTAFLVALVVVGGPLLGFALWLAPPRGELGSALPAEPSSAISPQVFTIPDGGDFPGEGLFRIGDEWVEAYRANTEGRPLAQGRQVAEHPESFAIRTRGLRGSEVTAHAAGTPVELPGGWFFPEGVSTFAGEVDGLFFQILWVTGLAFLATQLWLVATSWRLLRARAEGPARRRHGNVLVELFWVVLVGGLLLWLAFAQRASWDRMKGEATRPVMGPAATFAAREAWEGPPDAGGRATRRPVEWQILAVRYKWFFRHAGRDGAFGTGDDVTSGVLKVPKDRDVLFTVRSPDVIHSFAVPALRVKQDVVPGLAIPGWFRATETGTYPILCAELCGANHTQMAGTLEVVQDDDFYAFVMERSEEAAWDNLGADPLAPEFDPDDLDPLPRPEWYGVGQAKFWWWWDRNPTAVGFDTPLGRAR